MAVFLKSPIGRNAPIAIAVSVLILGPVANAGERLPTDGPAQRSGRPAGVQKSLPKAISPSHTIGALEFGIQPGKVVLERLPDGTRLYHMNGRGMQSIVAHRDEDGKIVITCTDKIDPLVQGSDENLHER
jgi:hypothetical protein